MAIVLVQGDGGSTLHATIVDSQTDMPFNLTGKTVKLAYTIASGTLVKKTMVPRNQGTSPGEADYQFLTTDLSAVGELEAEVILNDALSDMLTTNKFRIPVRARKI